MGKPFEKELENLEGTFEFTKSLDIDSFKNAINKLLLKPLYIIGSGGSFSACNFTELLHQNFGALGKAITPLESYYLQKSFQQSNILIVTAGGKNKDILFAFDQAIKAEPEYVINLCAAAFSPLAKRADSFSLSSTFEFPLPTNYDGFLASNSLLAFFILLARAYNYEVNNASIQKSEILKFKNEIDHFLGELENKTSTFNVLYAGWGKPVAIDIESKLTEAALANSLLADYRNFGHGRHHWFDKKKKNSAIVALITQEENELAKKTLLQLPKDVPVLKIKSENAGPSATIELLIKSFYFIDKVGKSLGIDPGRPGVPEFGSKLYHLNYTSFYKKNEKAIKTPFLEIQRKIKPENINNISADKLEKWVKNYKRFSIDLFKAHFGSIILDYDRTLCSEEKRLTGPTLNMIKQIAKILKSGFIIGVVTGRGLSVKKDLRNCISKRYWRNVVIGYYNGAQVGILANEELPTREEGSEPVFLEIRKLLKEAAIDNQILITQRTFQLTIESKNPRDWESIKPIIYQKSMAVRNVGFLILESGRSLDIIKRPQVSKLNIIDYIKNELKSRKLANECLCIGDKGKWPGNDFELLNTRYSLSVNDVSLDPNTCWNLAPLGIRNTDACLLYLKALQLHENYFNIIM